MVGNCRVVPRCYISQEGKVPRLLSGQALKDAELANSSTIEKQEEVVSNLKNLRSKRDSVRSEINSSDVSSEKRKLLEEELSATYAEYKAERYRDRRNYSAIMKSWKTTFENHLKLSKYSSWSRAATMACDVLLPYEVTSHARYTSKFPRSARHNFIE